MSRKTRFLARYSFAAASSLFLFTFGVASARHRGMISRIADHFGFGDRRGAIPRIGLDELVSDALRVELREPQSVDGNVSLYELLAISRLASRVEPRRIFEIGTFDGRTTLNLAANSPSDTRVYTLDLPRAEVDSTALAVVPSDRIFIDKERSGARFSGTVYEPKITQLYGDSATFDFGEFERTMDLVFVDGSHAYDYVERDSRTAMRLLSDRGIVLWHDYGVFEGVTRALDGLYLGDADFRSLRQIAGTSLVCLDRGTTPSLS